MVAPHGDGTAATAGPVRDDDQLEPASTRVRLRLGCALLVVTALAVVLAAGEAPVAVRGPVVLLAATFGPGFPLVARLPLTLPSLLALDACVSLGLEAAAAFALVEARVWHPLALGLGLAVFVTTGTLVLLRQLRAAR